jgi:5-deoxy-glucuronate isomerase
VSDRRVSWRGTLGYTQLFEPPRADLKCVSFGILSLRLGDVHVLRTEDREYALVFLSGIAAVAVGGHAFHDVGGRTSVFDGRAWAIYAPRHNTVVVTARTPVVAAVASAPAARDGKPHLVSPGANRLRRVGRDNWYREVFDVIDERVAAECLVVGETISPPGHWSSYPPHKHDVHTPPVESAQEEVYFYQVDPEAGFGVQRIYTDDRTLDETYTVAHNDAVAIPRGYHPVAAAPGYRLYYLWILAGKSRALHPHDDPVHAWVKQV